MNPLVSHLRRGSLLALSVGLALAGLAATAPAARPAHAFTSPCCTLAIYNPQISATSVGYVPQSIWVNGSGFVPGDAVKLTWYRGYAWDLSQPPLKTITVFATTGSYNSGTIFANLFLNTAEGDPSYHGPTWVGAVANGGPRVATPESGTVYI